MDIYIVWPGVLLWGVLLFFIVFDLIVFLLKKRKSESKTYFPDFKIWGMGFILGLTIFIFNYFEPLKDVLVGKKDTLLNKSEIVLENNMKLIEYRETSLEVIRQVVVMLFFLAIIGFILAAIVKITRDD